MFVNFFWTRQDVPGPPPPPPLHAWLPFLLFLPFYSSFSRPPPSSYFLIEIKSKPTTLPPLPPRNLRSFSPVFLFQSFVFRPYLLSFSHLYTLINILFLLNLREENKQFLSVEKVIFSK